MSCIYPSTYRRWDIWSQIDKNDYLNAMRESVADSTHIKALVLPALTTKFENRLMFMRGIDYSYYYEQNERFKIEHATKESFSYYIHPLFVKYNQRNLFNLQV